MYTLYEQFEVMGGLGKSDHDIVVVIPSMSQMFCLPKSYTAKVRSSTQNEKAMFSYDLRNTKWENLYHLPSCAEKFDFFNQVINGLIEHHFHWKLVEWNTNDKTWVNDHFS